VARSFVVTGGVGAGIVRMLRDRGDAVVVLDVAAPRADAGIALVGSAADADACRRAVAVAREHGVFSGWVNDAAVFRDVDLHASAEDAVAAITTNLAMAVVGSSVAVAALLEGGAGGSIVNVSSHAPAARPTRRCAPRRNRRTWALLHGRCAERSPTPPRRRASRG